MVRVHDPPIRLPELAPDDEQARRPGQVEAVRERIAEACAYSRARRSRSRSRRADLDEQYRARSGRAANTATAARRDRRRAARSEARRARSQPEPDGWRPGRAAEPEPEHPVAAEPDDARSEATAPPEREPRAIRPSGTSSSSSGRLRQRARLAHRLLVRRPPRASRVATHAESLGPSGFGPDSSQASSSECARVRASPIRRRGSSWAVLSSCRRRLRRPRKQGSLDELAAGRAVFDSAGLRLSTRSGREVEGNGRARPRPAATIDAQTVERSGEKRRCRRCRPSRRS